MAPRRWELANFAVFASINIAPADYTLSTIELLSIRSRFGATATGVPGTLLEGYARSFDVAGLVYDWDIQALTEPLLGVAVAPVWQLIVSDRIDAAGVPGGGAARYDITQPPIAIFQSPDGEDIDFPTRIHRRRSFLLPCGELNQFASTSGRVWPFGTERLRLRRRYTDTEGLFAQFACQNPNAEPLSLAIYLTGSLYYRLNFGA